MTLYEYYYYCSINKSIYLNSLVLVLTYLKEIFINIIVIIIICHVAYFDLLTDLKVISTHTGRDLPDVVRATNEVLDWFSLGLYLKVDYNKLETIRRDYPSDLNHCRQKMLITWISSGSATWNILVKTLRNDMNERELAERIEREHPH